MGRRGLALARVHRGHTHPAKQIDLYAATLTVGSLKPLVQLWFLWCAAPFQAGP